VRDEHDVEPGWTIRAIPLREDASYSVAERTREFGIRVAMGATPSDILRMVTSQTLGVVAIGVGLAAVGTAAVTRVMWAELLVIGASSWLGFTSIAAVIGLVALAACVIPARRATRVDPVVALRAE
jgi:ABC-type antimicrobial peptide transport system permease subunit